MGFALVPWSGGGTIGSRLKSSPYAGQTSTPDSPDSARDSLGGETGAEKPHVAITFVVHLLQASARLLIHVRRDLSVRPRRGPGEGPDRSPHAHGRRAARTHSRRCGQHAARGAKVYSTVVKQTTTGSLKKNVPPRGGSRPSQIVDSVLYIVDWQRPNSMLHTTPSSSLFFYFFSTQNRPPARLSSRRRGHTGDDAEAQARRRPAARRR